MQYCAVFSFMSLLLCFFYISSLTSADAFAMLYFLTNVFLEFLLFIISLFFLNKTGNVCINVTLRGLRVTTVAVEKRNYIF